MPILPVTRQLVAPQKPLRTRTRAINAPYAGIMFFRVPLQVRRSAKGLAACGAEVAGRRKGPIGGSLGGGDGEDIEVVGSETGGLAVVEAASVGTNDISD